MSRLPEPSPSKLPRWRGFNLPNLTSADRAKPYEESDYALIAEWGFDFARLPLSYRLWSEPATWTQIDETAMREVDRGVDLGRKHDVHVSLNLHRIPGYCVNQPLEPTVLWEDEDALAAACLHWKTLAQRYAGRPNRELSYNLINEPRGVDGPNYARVAGRLAEAIWSVDPGRLIIADGIDLGNTPVPELIPLGLASGTRGYEPKVVSHHRASWVPADEGDILQIPEWPMDWEGHHWNKADLEARFIRPFAEFEAAGGGVHVGEWGAFRYTPHAVALAWMKDLLELWEAQGWGWAMWNLRGPFGPLDSLREDVAYEAFRGHQLDRAMLDLLQAH